MKTLKKIILSCLAVALLGILFYVAYFVVHYKLYDEYKSSFKTYVYREGTPYKPLSENVSDVEGMDLVSESDALKLYANVKTGEVAVYDKRNGKTTYSNPLDCDDDPIANGSIKKNMKSQLYISYYTASRNLAYMSSYEYCTSVGQLEVESIDHGIRFIYTIGDLSSKTGLVPTKVLEDRMAEITSSMDEKAAKYILSKYQLKNGIYEVPESTKTKQATIRKMNKYLEEIGYTSEDCTADSMAAGVEDAVAINFVIPMEYTLCDDYIEVNVPTNQIQEHGGGSIYTINVLNYFDAAGTNEEGYFLVPNGSGSLIQFNNGKSDAALYAQNVYDQDPLVANYNQVQYAEQVYLPVWGIQKKDTTILASIESGSSLAMIQAGVSGKIGSYNYASAAFTLRGAESLEMAGSTGNEADLPVVEKNFAKTDLTTRYTFLTNDYQDYSGMANYYRERLIQEEKLKVNTEERPISLYLDILGGVKRTDYAMGVQYNEVCKMTTFDDAKTIASYFIDDGIVPIINYQGWFNKGYYHEVPDKIKGVGKLGGEKSMESLSEYLEQNNGKLYGDVQFQKVCYTSRGFSNSEEASRFYASGFPVAYGMVNPVNLQNDWSLGYKDRLYYVLSPKYILRYVNKFMDKFEKYDVTGISLRDLGSTLASDKKRTNTIDREQALSIVQCAFSNIEESDKDIMVSSPNSYSWKYADDLINVPMNGNDFFIVDEHVPFYEMLVHGCIDYCGSSINLSDNYDYTATILNLLEYGGAPHFTFSWEDTKELKYTSLGHWYNISFKENKQQIEAGIPTFKEDAKNMYHEVSKILNQVTNSKIVKHEILESGVRKVTYDNGIEIYVNYNDYVVNVDGLDLNARDYYMKGGLQ